MQRKTVAMVRRVSQDDQSPHSDQDTGFMAQPNPKYDVRKEFALPFKLLKSPLDIRF